MTSTRAERTREAILDATDRLLATRGFRDVTMEEIAEEANCSRRSVYSHFATKAEVGLSSIDRVIEKTQERLAAIANEPSPTTVRLRKMLIERVLFRVDSVRPYRKSLNELFEAVRPLYMERRQKHLAREANLLAEVLEEGRRASAFAFDDPESMATTLIQATNAFLPYSLRPEEIEKRTHVVVAITRMADLLLAGLTPRREPNAPSGSKATSKSSQQ